MRTHRYWIILFQIYIELNNFKEECSHPDSVLSHMCRRCNCTDLETGPVEVQQDTRGEAGTLALQEKANVADVGFL